MNETIINALSWRYAVQSFDTSKKVSEADLRTILESGRLSASSFGLEPWKFIVVENSELRTKLAAAGYGQAKITEASHLIVIARRTDTRENIVAERIARTATIQGVTESALDGFKQMLDGTVAGRDDAALIQKHNTEILVNNAREDLEFLNIIHGANYETYARYHDIVQRDDLDMLSIASIYRSEIVKSIHTLAKIINHGKRYKQYHLLGIYNIAMVAPLIWFAQKMGVNISTDASTHVKSGINRMFHSQHLPTSPVSRLIIGNNGGVPPSRNNFTPCSCPVCTNVKYMDILAYVPGSTATFALVLHNMFETIRYVDMMCNAAKTLNSNQYIELMKKQLGNHPTKESSVKAIRLIDEIVEHGIAKAEKKFSYFLSESMTEDLLANPLIAEEDNGDEPEMTVDAFKERVWSMIRTYEERDGTRLTKMKTKKKGDKKERGHVLSTKGHTRPGKKKKKIKKKVLVKRRREENE
jgi:hypothetical protein